MSADFEVTIKAIENGYILTAPDGKHYFYITFTQTATKIKECFGIKEDA